MKNLMAGLVAAGGVIALQANSGRLTDWVGWFAVIIFLSYGAVLADATVSRVRRAVAFFLTYFAALLPGIVGGWGIGAAIFMLLLAFWVARFTHRPRIGAVYKRWVEPPSITRIFVAAAILGPAWLLLVAAVIYYFQGEDSADLAVYGGVFYFGVSYYLAEAVIRPRLA